MSGLYPKVIQNCIVPIYDLAKGMSRFKYGLYLKNTQWLEKKDIKQIQFKNLRLMLKYAYETVPYYHQLFKKEGLLPKDIKSIEDMVKIPILTKDSLRANSDTLISNRFPKKGLIPYKSGGSGNQLKFFITKDQLSWEIAAEYRAYGWAGYELGNRCFMFWGSHIDIKKHVSKAKKLANQIERVFIADTYVLSEKIMNRFATQMRRKKPDIIRGYASSVFSMANYLLDNGIDYIRPRAVITSAETLYDDRRKVIEKAFNCRVFDYYGSREVGALAAECDEHSGYHISAENALVEIIKSGEQANHGEKGQIVVTSLRNYGMPFLRYAIGDVGILSEKNCDCGRGLPLLSSIQGRTSEFLAVYDKKLDRIIPVGPVYPMIIYGLMQVPLKSVRLVQESLDRIVLKGVKDEGYAQKHTDYLIKYFRQFLGDDFMVDFEFLDYLEPLPSGKRASFVSKINSFKDL